MKRPPYRPPRLVSPMFGRRPRQDDPLPPGRVIVDMHSPGDIGFRVALKRASQLLCEDKIACFNLVGTLPERVVAGRKEGSLTAHSDGELARLDIQPWAISVTRPEKPSRLLFKVAAAVDDIPMVTAFAEVVSLFPKIVRAFLSVMKPWHLALLGVEGFDDVERPPPEELHEATVTALRTLKRWGIRIEVVGDDEVDDVGIKEDKPA